MISAKPNHMNLLRRASQAKQTGVFSGRPVHVSACDRSSCPRVQAWARARPAWCRVDVVLVRLE